jgi:hypothetical protein
MKRVYLSILVAFWSSSGRSRPGDTAANTVSCANGCPPAFNRQIPPRHRQRPRNLSGARWMKPRRASSLKCPATPANRRPGRPTSPEHRTHQHAAGKTGAERTFAVAWADKPPVARMNDLVPDKTLDEARDGALAAPRPPRSAKSAAIRRDFQAAISKPATSAAAFWTRADLRRLAPLHAHRNCRPRPPAGTKKT